jgi:hypothetical protein
MRNNETKKAIAIVILSILVGVLILNNILTSCGVYTTSTDPDKYDYGVPLQHVVELHYTEIGYSLVAEDAYPVFETNDDGWIVYTIRSKHSGDRLKDMVFYGPEFWDSIKSGKMSATNNWQE